MRFRFHACVSERAESNVTTAHERVVTGLVRTALPLRLRAMLIAGTTTVQNQHVVQKQVSKSTKSLNMRLETLKQDILQAFMVLTHHTELIENETIILVQNIAEAGMGFKCCGVGHSLDLS